MDPSVVKVFAPATCGNLGPGFDVIGAALEYPGDIIRASRRTEPGVTLRGIRSENGDPVDLPMDETNTACVAARYVLEQLDADWGVELELLKGLPIGSGLGSSGASAVAAAVAVNFLAGELLDTKALLQACVEAERQACGAPHADNVAPALLGGVVVVAPGVSPVRLETDMDLWLAMITPQVEVQTRVARAAIPQTLPIADVTANCGNFGLLTYALARGDAELLKPALVDRIAEPRRLRLIPNFLEIKTSALGAGALGASISGSGPSVFAMCIGKSRASQVKEEMARVLHDRGMPYRAWISRISSVGARRI